MIGYVYKLIDKRDDEPFYVGSTTWPLNKRLSGHKTDVRRNKEGLKLRRRMRRIGLNNIGIELLQTLHNTTRERLKKREKYWIHKLESRNHGNTFHPI